jgi:hypothetical protein
MRRWRDERATASCLLSVPVLIAFYRVTNHGCALELLLLRVFLSADTFLVLEPQEPSDTSQLAQRRGVIE